MRAAGLRLFLVLCAAAIAATNAVLLVAAGLPLAAVGGLRPAALVLLVLVTGTVAFVAGAFLLARAVGRPIERLLSTAARLEGSASRLPPLGESDGFAPSRAAVAFDRVAAELADERARLAAKVEELTRANREVDDARASLARSERLATLGRLAAGVAHEVGNPLAHVAGYVEIARARLPRDASPELVDALARIDAAGHRIDRIVRDLLDFARPAPVALAPVRLEAAVDATLRLARVEARFKSAAVEVDVPAGLPPVLADEHHLSQVLLNLLLNAGDATGGGGRVRVAARPLGDRVELSVEDDGPGIAPADLPRIFDPFFTTKDPGQGTGLGLSISHRLVEAFGGEIAAENRPGGGAAFHVRLRQAPSRLR